MRREVEEEEKKGGRCSKIGSDGYTKCDVYIAHGDAANPFRLFIFVRGMMIGSGRSTYQIVIIRMINNYSNSGVKNSKQDSF